MTRKTILTKHHQTFDRLRHVDDAGGEFWRVRELAEVLEYSQYRHFVPVLEKPP